MPRRKKGAPEAAKKIERRSEKTPNRLLGMKDWVGSECRYFDFVVTKANEFAKIYSFTPIKTPIMESLDLYKKSTRHAAEREFYSVEGEKSEKMVLRPEMTQGVIRAYLENNLGESGLPARLFSLGPIFRHEKLQTGHYRESTQMNLEIIGEDKPLAEALLVTVAHNFFAELGIKTQVQINSIGSSECRREYCNKLLSFYKERGRRSKLCNSCKNNLGKNCLSLLDCTEEACVKAREEAPQIADYLSTESREHFTKTLEFLDELNINYNFNPYLVRGLNYYNDTVFEFWPINEDGSILGKIALGGGGRYDSLVENLGGASAPAIGLAIGIERTLAKIKDKQLLINKQEEDIVFIAQLGDQAKLKSLQLFEDLRNAGFNVRQSFASDSLRTQLEEATTMQAKTSLILGKKEIMDGTILMRDMDSGAQETVVYKKIKERLSKKDKLIEKRLNNRKEGGLYGGL
ncbi:MAG: histidine--tRNA ligase [Patescibacteria group bacterium]|jgi:histidyl-tRNA synthetase